MDFQNEQATDEAIDQMLNEIVDKIFSESQENIIRYGAVDTGHMLRSGNVNRKFLEKEIVYSAPYAVSVEYGREPGSMPPVQPIKKWLMRKFHMREKEAENTAWAIAKKIQKSGTRARPFLRDAVNTVSAEYGGI